MSSFDKVVVSVMLFSLGFGIGGGMICWKIEAETGSKVSQLIEMHKKPAPTPNDEKSIAAAGTAEGSTIQHWPDRSGPEHQCIILGQIYWSGLPKEVKDTITKVLKEDMNYEVIRKTSFMIEENFPLVEEFGYVADKAAQPKDYSPYFRMKLFVTVKATKTSGTDLYIQETRLYHFFFDNGKTTFSWQPVKPFP